MLRRGSGDCAGVAGRRPPLRSRRLVRIERASSSVSGSGRTPSCFDSSRRHLSYCARAASWPPLRRVDPHQRAVDVLLQRIEGEELEPRGQRLLQSSASLRAAPSAAHGASRRAGGSARARPEATGRNPAPPTDRPSISSPPISSAAARSIASSVEPAAAASTLASIHADPGRQVTASLVATIGCGSDPASAARSSESAWRRLARAWPSLRSPHSRPVSTSREISAPSRSAR